MPLEMHERGAARRGQTAERAREGPDGGARDNFAKEGDLRGMDASPEVFYSEGFRATVIFRRRPGGQCGVLCAFSCPLQDANTAKNTPAAERREETERGRTWETGRG